MCRKLLFALLPFMLAALFLLPSAATSYAANQHQLASAGSAVSMFPKTKAQRLALPHAPRQLATCYDDGVNPGQPQCDGYAPPPISYCSGVQQLQNEKTIFDSRGAAIGHLDLFYSNGNGCLSWWVGLKNIQGSGGYCFSITHEDVVETGTNDDGSVGFSLDTLPHSLCPGKWESSVMVGDGFVVRGENPCYHGESDVKDHYNGSTLITNTNTFCQ